MIQMNVADSAAEGGDRMEKIFPENIFTERINPDKVYYETRNFINSVLPFSLHIDIMVNTSHHYVHKHREIEILSGISGSGQVISDLKPISVTANEIVVINPNKVHYIVSDNIFQYYCLIIDSDFLEANGIDPESIYFKEHIVDSGLPAMLERLNAEWNREDEYRNMMLKSCVIGIIVELCRNYQINETMIEREGKTLQKIKHSINYIKNNFRSELTLDDVAGEAGLSKYHYCREFKKATDLTPVEFINRTRCEFAKTLLEAKKYSVTEIGEMSGFSTSAHFSKTFRSFFGAYPSDYMKKYDSKGQAR